jgi:hypothetical protein
LGPNVTSGGSECYKNAVPSLFQVLGVIPSKMSQISMLQAGLYYIKGNIRSCNHVFQDQLRSWKSGMHGTQLASSCAGANIGGLCHLSLSEKKGPVPADTSAWPECVSYLFDTVKAGVHAYLQ